MSDFFEFRSMVTPMVIQIVFATLVVLAVLAGIVAFVNDNALGGVLFILFGPVVSRLVCELMIVVFRIHSALVTLDEKMSTLIEVSEDSGSE